jgi:hypothetical protein
MLEKCLAEEEESNSILVEMRSIACCWINLDM